MKRDLELVRLVLLRIEAVIDRPLTSITIYPHEADLVIDGYTPEQVLTHIILVIDAGFLDADIGADGHVVLKKLTWEGCEFLDDVRDPEVWRKTKERAGALAGAGVAFIWEIAKAEMRTRLGLS